MNSLSGDLLNASLQCLKPNGRFIEIGKIGIKSSAEFQAQWPQARYEVFALDDLVSSQSLAVGSVLSGLMKRFADGVLHPCPHRSFSLGQAPAAFRLMSRARHIGKVVLMSGADASAIARSHQETRGLIDSAIIDSNGTYLITGASGGLGQQVALWLADQGAKRLVLAARRNPDETAQAAIARLVARGVEVSVQQADVARREDVVRVIQECGSNLRGVFHLAGVIDDALLMQMNARRWQRVWQPKVLGAWNLHEETRGLPLDFFVLFSSAAAILGSAGQANYACCTFRGLVTALDAGTGREVWKTYTIPEAAKVVGQNSLGKDMLAPAGAGVWVTPTLDLKRRALYIATGNAFSGTPATANAVMAFNMDTGKVLWQSRLGTSVQGFPMTYSVNGKQYIAVTTGLGGGSTRGVPSVLAPEVRYPAYGAQLYVFALPDRR